MEFLPKEKGVDDAHHAMRKGHFGHVITYLGICSTFCNFNEISEAAEIGYLRDSLRTYFLLLQ